MFKSARLKLTLWYLLIIMLICTFFSVGMYKLSTDEFDRFSQAQKFRYERRFELDKQLLPPEMRQRFAEPLLDVTAVTELKNKVALSLLVIDIMIFLVSGILSYFLAGITLRPIKLMVDDQNRFISDASHELRTPLTALKSSMEVFLREQKPKLEEAKVLIQDSILDVDKLSALSSSLLQLIQYQKPSTSFKFESLEATELLNQVILKIKPLAEKKHITINQISESAEFYGDKHSLTELFVILLDNAVKYSDAGKRITISSLKTDGYMEFKVKDEGVGISSKDLPHIFDRFYRSDDSRSNVNVSGFGLGLSIAKKIVDMHKGLISVTSEPTKGATFVVKIPVAK